MIPIYFELFWSLNTVQYLFVFCNSIKIRSEQQNILFVHSQIFYFLMCVLVKGILKIWANLNRPRHNLFSLIIVSAAIILMYLVLYTMYVVL